MLDRDSKVIGYYGVCTCGEAICAADGALMVAGSERSMRACLLEDAVATIRIRKIRFGEIVGAMRSGVPYAFDEEAYGRFYPLGRLEGLPLPPGEFAAHRDLECCFLTVYLSPRKAPRTKRAERTQFELNDDLLGDRPADRPTP